MNNINRWFKDRSDWSPWLVGACVFAVGVCLYMSYGCANIEVVKADQDVIKTPTCSFADGIDCQKCHDFYIAVAPFYNPDKTIHYFEMILPEGVEIDWATMTYSDILNPKSKGADWVTKYIFSAYDEDTGVWTLHIIYNHWNQAYAPPKPPLALVRVISQNPSNMLVEANRQFWIYSRGMPIEVTEGELDAWLWAVKTGERV